MNHWKRVSLVAFERKKNKNNKKIIPMYFAIVSEYTFSVFYKNMNKYLFYIKQLYAFKNLKCFFL